MSDSGRLSVHNWCKHALLLYCDLIIILPKIATLLYVSTFVLLYTKREAVVFGTGYGHFHCP
jgi:hypothetical protein